MFLIRWLNSAKKPEDIVWSLYSWDKHIHFRGIEKTPSLQPAGRLYAANHTLFWLFNQFDRSGPKENLNRGFPHYNYRVIGRICSFHEANYRPQLTKTIMMASQVQSEEHRRPWTLFLHCWYWFLRYHQHYLLAFSDEGGFQVIALPWFFVCG